MQLSQVIRTSYLHETRYTDRVKNSEMHRRRPLDYPNGSSLRDEQVHRFESPEKSLTKIRCLQCHRTCAEGDGLECLRKPRKMSFLLSISGSEELNLKDA